MSDNSINLLDEKSRKILNNAENIRGWLPTSVSRVDHSLKPVGTGLYPSAPTVLHHTLKTHINAPETHLNALADFFSTTSLDNYSLSRQKNGQNDLEANVYKGSSCLKKTGCGQKMVKLKCKMCGNIHYKLYECGHRLCPRCAKKKSRAIFHQIRDLIDRIRVPVGMNYKMITLTIKKTSFKDDVGRAMAGIGKILHNILEKYGLGAVAHLELSPSGEVHWHILFLGKYIPQKMLSDKWKKITGGSAIVDIRKIDGCKGILEITKYIMKFGEVSENMQWAFYEIIKNHRVLRTFGIFYGETAIKPQLVCMFCGGTDWEYLEKTDITSFIFHQWFIQNKLREKWKDTG
jgi:hypothetical protein